MPEFATSEPITATLTTSGARIRVAASDRSDTVVRVEPINSASKSDVKVADHTKVDFANGALTIKTTVQGDKNGSVAISVELPSGSGLVLNTARTEVRADGVLGDCELNVASGQIQLDRVAALRARLATGELAVGHIAGTAAVEGGASGLRIAEVEGEVRYEGASGAVWIGTARADLHLTSGRGSFDIDRADGSVTAKSGSCPIRIGRMTRGQADLANASGGIEVGISEGTAAWVDAKSTKGTVRTSLPTQDSPDEFGSKVRIHARARLDDIVIHRAGA